jgi:hypothetical protein
MHMIGRHQHVLVLSWGKWTRNGHCRELPQQRLHPLVPVHLCKRKRTTHEMHAPSGEREPHVSSPTIRLSEDNTLGQRADVPQPSRSSPLSSSPQHLGTPCALEKLTECSLRFGKTRHRARTPTKGSSGTPSPSSSFSMALNLSSLTGRRPGEGPVGGRPGVLLILAVVVAADRPAVRTPGHTSGQGGTATMDDCVRITDESGG